MFDDQSRYKHLAVKETESADGEVQRYVNRRFIPAADRYQRAGVAAVTDSERPDTIAHRYLGSYGMFWQIADANEVMRPEELTDETGESLTIPMPRHPLVDQ